MHLTFSLQAKKKYAQFTINKSETSLDSVVKKRLLNKKLDSGLPMIKQR